MSREIKEENFIRGTEIISNAAERLDNRIFLKMSFGLNGWWVALWIFPILLSV